MIKIRTSMLESVRKNPLAYGRLIAAGDDSVSGGSHGMFACMVDVARAVHLKKVNLRQAIRQLHSKFLRFKPNDANRIRQDRLVEQLVAYLRLVKKMGLEWVDGSRRIQWSITSDVVLTGLTPWVVADEKGYISFIMAEKSFEWKNQLRFPLYQKYISENTIECKVEEIRVGFYFADVNKFDLRTFKTNELKMAVDETGEVFKILYNEYEKRRSK